MRFPQNIIKPCSLNDGPKVWKPVSIFKLTSNKLTLFLFFFRPIFDSLFYFSTLLSEYLVGIYSNKVICESELNVQWQVKGAAPLCNLSVWEPRFGGFTWVWEARLVPSGTSQRPRWYQLPPNSILAVQSKFWILILAYYAHWSQKHVVATLSSYMRLITINIVFQDCVAKTWLSPAWVVGQSPFPPNSTAARIISWIRTAFGILRSPTLTMSSKPNPLAHSGFEIRKSYLCPHA